MSEQGHAEYVLYKASRCQLLLCLWEPLARVRVLCARSRVRLRAFACAIDCVAAARACARVRACVRSC
eukprot:3952696-Lingulodinium_polyedra.AAC.1